KDRLGPPPCGDRIFILRALHRVIGECEIADIPGKGSNMIKASHERERPCTRQPPISGLEPKHATKRSRYPDRTIGIRTEGDRYDPCPNRGTRAARGSSGHTA